MAQNTPMRIPLRRCATPGPMRAPQPGTAPGAQTCNPTAPMTTRKPRTPPCFAALRPTVLIVPMAILMCACGGGSPNSPLVNTKSYPAVTITGPAPRTTVHAGVEVQFDGGVCGGGNGQLTASWNYGDNTPLTPSNTHTYARAGSFPLWVQCTDTSGSPSAVVVGNILVLP